MLETCLKTLVGLSRSDCSCFDDDRPADYNTSLSGLYIADGVKLKMTKGAADCEEGGVWDILETARDRAINDVSQDILLNISSHYDELYEPFYSKKNGLIGNKNITQTKVSPTQIKLFNGLKIKYNDIKGGFFTLQGVELALLNFAGPIDVDVSLYSNVDFSTPLTTTTVTLINPKTFYSASFPTPYKIDLSELDYESDKIEYYLMYELPSGAQIPQANIKRGCGCGGAKRQIQNNPWIQFVDLQGISNTDIATLDNPSYTNSYTMGLRVKAVASCDYLTDICDYANDFQELKTLGNQDYRFASAIANIVNTKAQAIVLDIIIKSSNVNRYTLFSREGAYGQRNQLLSNYKKYMQWFLENMPLHRNDCLTCHDNRNVSINTIKTQ